MVTPVARRASKTDRANLSAWDIVKCDQTDLVTIVVEKGCPMLVDVFNIELAEYSLTRNGGDCCPKESKVVRDSAGNDVVMKADNTSLILSLPGEYVFKLTTVDLDTRQVLFKKRPMTADQASLVLASGVANYVNN